MSRRQPRPIDEQVVVIVGASSGIGRAAAQAFAHAGAQLLITARDGGALEELAAELRAAGTRVE